MLASPRFGSGKLPGIPAGSEPLLLAAACAWVLLVASSAFGAVKYLDHDRIFAGAPDFASYAAFGVAWLVMVVAMMLPIATPRLRSCPGDRNTRNRWLRLIGYLISWEIFGFALLAFDGLLHRSVSGNGWLQRGEYVIWPGVLLLIAGGEAFCAWRRRFGVYVSGGTPPTAAFDSLLTGVRLACDGVGMCGAIMLFMLAAGAHNIGSIVLLSGLAAYQQLGRFGGLLAAGLAALAAGNALFALAVRAAIP